MYFISNNSWIRALIADQYAKIDGYTKTDLKIFAILDTEKTRDEVIDELDFMNYDFISSVYDEQQSQEEAMKAKYRKI